MKRSGYDRGGSWHPTSSRRGPSQYASSANDDEKAKMVNLIKNAQRTAADWAASWTEYCTEFGAGRADPAKHSISFLCQAIKTLGLPTGEVEKQKLVTHIKMYQRGSIEARDKWIAYCDDQGDSRYDPGHYDVEYLKRGFEMMESVCPEGHSTSPADPDRHNESQLVHDVKELQKNDVVAHEAWVEYCTLHSDGTLDPKRFDDRFLGKAITFMRRSATLVEGIKEMTRGGGRSIWRRYCDDHGSQVYDPVLHTTDFLEKAHAYTRRHLDRAQGGVTSSGRGSAGISARGGGGGRGSRRSTSSDLIEEFKEHQRSSPGFADFWRDYCETYGQGYFDPAKYDESFLQEAIAEFGYVSIFFLYFQQFFFAGKTCKKAKHDFVGGWGRSSVRKINWDFF